MKVLTKTHMVQVLGYASAVTAAGFVMYLWLVLGDRGIDADRLHVSGYTLPSEIVLGIVALLLAISGALIINMPTDFSKRHRKMRITFQVTLISITVLFCTIVSFMTT